MQLKDLVSNWLWWISALAVVKQLQEDKFLAAAIFAILVLVRLKTASRSEQGTFTNSNITRNGWSIKYTNPTTTAGERTSFAFTTPGGVDCFYAV